MSEHRRRRRPQMMQIEQLEQEAQLAQEASAAEAAAEQEIAADAQDVNEAAPEIVAEERQKEDAQSEEIQPEEQPSEENQAEEQASENPAAEAKAAKAKAAQENLQRMKEMAARIKPAAAKAAEGAKAAGIVLLGLLVLLGEKIAVCADAAHRALQKHAGVPQAPAAELVRESALQAEDLHGAAARRKQREQMHRENLRRGLMAVCMVVAVVSLVMMSRVIIRSVRTNRLNHELAERRAELIAQSESEEQAEVAPDHTPEFVIFTGETAQEESAGEGADAELAAEMEAETALASAEPAAEKSEEAEKAEPAVKRPIVKNTQYHVSSGTPLPQMATLYEQNRDLIGWLEIPEVLDLPVMYKDNSYYLKRDFNKQKNEAGTLFLDENHRFSELTQNLLLHGHNMKDGTMFGRLLQYHTDINYLKNNPFVNFDTLWKEEKYVIFAVLRVSLDVTSDDFFNYFSYPRFNSDEEFNAYIRRLQLRSEYSIPMDVKPSDALLTLSTCLDEDRLVIVCRRFREGETRSQLRQIIQLASRQ